MKISIPVNNENLLDKKYGGYAQKELLINGSPKISFPIEWNDFNNDSKYVHIVLVDYDSNPVCGFTYFHWGIANIEIEKYKLGIPENFSESHKNELCQAINSSFVWSKDKNDALGYYGPFPPNCPHIYTMYIITTNQPLNLENGWLVNDIARELERLPIIEWEKINFKYNNF